MLQCVRKGSEGFLENPLVQHVQPHTLLKLIFLKGSCSTGFPMSGRSSPSYNDGHNPANVAAVGQTSPGGVLKQQQYQTLSDAIECLII